MVGFMLFQAKNGEIQKKGEIKSEVFALHCVAPMQNKFPKKLSEFQPRDGVSQQAPRRVERSAPQ